MSCMERSWKARAAAPLAARMYGAVCCCHLWAWRGSSLLLFSGLKARARFQGVAPLWAIGAACMQCVLCVGHVLHVIMGECSFYNMYSGLKLPLALKRCILLGSNVYDTLGLLCYGGSSRRVAMPYCDRCQICTHCTSCSMMWQLLWVCRAVALRHAFLCLLAAGRRKLPRCPASALLAQLPAGVLTSAWQSSWKYMCSSCVAVVRWCSV